MTAQPSDAGERARASLRYETYDACLPRLWRARASTRPGRRDSRRLPSPLSVRNGDQTALETQAQALGALVPGRSAQARGQDQAGLDERSQLDRMRCHADLARQGNQRRIVAGQPAATVYRADVAHRQGSRELVQAVRPQADDEC